MPIGQAEVRGPVESDGPPAPQGGLHEVRRSAGSESGHGQEKESDQCGVAGPVSRPGSSHRLHYGAGRSIGNFGPAEALAFLAAMRLLCGVPGSGLLIGVDTWRKDEARLHAAYDGHAARVRVR